MREDLLEHRLLQDRRNDLQLDSAVRAVLQRQRSSRIHRKTPNQAAPDRPLLNTRLWPGP
jgi:hypothetical protein